MPHNASLLKEQFNIICLETKVISVKDEAGLGNAISLA